MGAGAGFDQLAQAGIAAAHDQARQKRYLDDALLEQQAAPIVEKLKDPNTTAEDANTLRGSLIQMYGRGQSHKAIAKLNDIYGVTPEPAATTGTTGATPDINLPGGISVPGQAGTPIDVRPKTVNEILATHPNAPLTPAEVHQAARIHAGLDPKAVPDKPDKPVTVKDVTWLTDSDGNQHPFRVVDGKFSPVEGAEDLTPPSKVKPEAGPKVGSFGDFMMAAFGAHPTAEQYAQGRKKWAEAVASNTSGTHEVMVDDNGTLKAVTVTTTSQKHIGGSDSGLPTTRQDVPGAIAPPVATPTPSAARPTRPKAGPASTGDTGDGPGRVVGHKYTPDQIKAMESADIAETAYNTAVARANVTDPVQKAIGDTGLVLAWAKTQILGGGRLNNAEIERGIKAGAYDTRISNAYNRAVNGTLDDDFRTAMVNDLGITAKEMRAQADKTLTKPGKTAKDLKDSAPNKPAPTKGKHSLATAMALPFNQGKTKEAVKADLEAHGYEVIP